MATEHIIISGVMSIWQPNNDRPSRQATKISEAIVVSLDVKLIFKYFYNINIVPYFLE